MQSINTGFVALRAQMPHIQGEKLSKVGPLKPDILQAIKNLSNVC